MNKLFKTALAGLMVIGLTGCGSSSSAAATAAASDAAATAAAADGGTLVIYSPNSDTEVDNIIPAFEKATGITVQLVSAGTGECISRIQAEKDNPQGDIMWGGMNYGVYLQDTSLWEDYTSPNESKIDENYRQGDVKAYSNYLLSGSGALILNNALIKELGVTVEGYEDLLQPELKGKIAAADPTKSSSAWAELTNMLYDMGDKPYDDKAWEYVKSYIGQLNGVQLESSSAVYKGVAAGEYAVGVSYEDPCVALLASGADVTVVYPKEGAIWLPSASAIIKGCQHEDAAKKFIDYLQSDECQTIIAGLTVRGVNTSIPASNTYMKPLSEINVVYEDIPYVAEHKAEWQEKYGNMFAGN